MKTALRFLFPAILVALVATTASADVDSKLLVGDWEGDLIISTPKKSQAQKATFSFHADGTLVAKREGEKEERATYEILGDKIHFKSTDQPEMYLTKIKLTKSALEGTFEPAGKTKLPPGITISVKLKR